MTGTHDLKAMADGAAVSLSLLGVMGWLTPVVAFVGSVLSLIYLAIRIWETDTVKKLRRQDA
jgi:hypothetical protein